MPETPAPEQDPVVSQSLSKWLLISSLILVLTLIWAMADEVWLQRPWKRYQANFVHLYTSYLKKLNPVQSKSEDTIRKSAGYQQIFKQIEETKKTATPELARINKELEQIQVRLSSLTEDFQTVRSHIAALNYNLEIASASSKPGIRKDIEEVRKERQSLKLVKADGQTERVSWDFDQMEKEYTSLKDRRAQLQAELIKVNAPRNALEQKLAAYVKDQLTGLTDEQIRGLLEKMHTFSVDIKQIHIKEIDLVDRCESCHLGIREPVELTKAAMGGSQEFVSHPSRDLLKIHNPERFGCTPCHNGNGIATTSVEKGHGSYEHWLWPLFTKANIEAGCQQCHNNEIVTDYAETLNAGRELFRGKGCMGCHRFEGFDREPDYLQNARQQMRQLEMEKGDAEREMTRAFQKMDDPKTSDEEVARLKARADQIRVNINKMNEQIEQLDVQASSLMREVKKVGPSWKELRVKLRKEWIPVWIKDPHEFRPATKMPSFRLAPDEIQAIAAFVWQTGVEGKLEEQKPGDAGRGKELFETRGCTACHSVGEGSNARGGPFAANLSRVGEKANYNYLVRWVHNPRERTRPYCALEKRDIGPEDYAKHGKPFVFDLEHAACPNDGFTLQVQQMTVMPSLRLTWDEARDIASYLATLKKDGASYPPAPFLDDLSLKEKGIHLVRNYGCAGCHEISGLEDEGRIGTELTKEGSKPIERLDFALLTHPAKQGIQPPGFPPKKSKESWYNHKGFFEHKLKQPDVYDVGKEKPQLERLKMPNFRLADSEINALATLLLGAVDSQLPESYFYRPQDQRRDIQEGWWIIRKYNCMGCHVLRANQQTVFMTLPRYQDPDWKEQMPPQLVGEGARVDPAWLVRFLSNPSLSTTDTNRNGVRSYLKARMPTFSFSEGEVDKLVRFFMALSSQASPFVQPRKGMEALTEAERTMARQLFTSKGAPCLKCHATGNAAHDARATAPNFLMAKERLKPGWTFRWLLDPALIAPGTAMPSGLFRREGDHWVFNGPLPDRFKGYTRDHAELLVRYMFQ
ncbi:MAG: c-type cytochrome, partial [Acidobacteria bacterium]|nr:c-type cytochrome [Acidobacteriota bacterium]